MLESIRTHSVGRGIAVTDDLILDETVRTRTLFRPAVHQGGVRGHIIRQKRGNDGLWLDVNEVNFNQLPPDCGVRIELDTGASQRLHERLSQLYALQQRGVEPGDRHYVVGEEDEVVIINDSNKAGIIRTLVEQGLSEEVWDALASTDPDLASRLAAGRIQQTREAAIREFRSALVDEAGNEQFWQVFFERNNWILQAVFPSTMFLLGSEVYVGGKTASGRQGIGGVATDFLLSDDSTKSFAVVEIKTPDAKLVGSQYRGTTEGGTNEVFSMHQELTGGVVQTQNQISVAVDQFEAVLGRTFEHGLNRLHPSGVLISGDYSALSESERESFNQFRHGLHNLTIVGYDELLKQLEALYGVAPLERDRAEQPGQTASEDEIPF